MATLNQAALEIKKTFTQRFGYFLSFVKRVYNHNQEEVAKLLGLSQQTLTGFKTGKYESAPLPILLLIEKQFGIRQQWLSQGEGDIFLAEFTSNAFWQCLCGEENIHSSGDIHCEECCCSSQNGFQATLIEARLLLLEDAESYIREGLWCLNEILKDSPLVKEFGPQLTAGLTSMLGNHKQPGTLFELQNRLCLK